MSQFGINFIHVIIFSNDTVKKFVFARIEVICTTNSKATGKCCTLFWGTFFQKQPSFLHCSHGGSAPQIVCALQILLCTENFGTRKVEVLNSLIMNITAKDNDTNDILQTFR